MKNSAEMIKDFEYINSCDFIPWEKLRDSTVMVTGATGLIGSALIKSILFVNGQRQLNIKVLALVRSKNKVDKVFRKESLDASLSFIYGDVIALPEIHTEIDYIIHGASATSSSYFVQHPVETISIAVDGTRNLLELARSKQVKGIIYLSSMEVYGHPKKGHAVAENEVGGFDPTNVRNCYPLSKQICESICSSYAAEYNVPVMCIRLTQTFGPGVQFDDGRVFAEFMRAAVNKTDIVLKTKGDTERCYLYTADAVTAILTVLLKGSPKQSYNAANPQTYCSIAEMAALVANNIANGMIKVLVQLENIEQLGYASTLYMALDVSKLEALGWKPAYGLEQMFENMISSAERE